MGVSPIVTGRCGSTTGGVRADRVGEAPPAKAGGSWPVKLRLAVAALSPGERTMRQATCGRASRRKPRLQERSAKAHAEGKLGARGSVDRVVVLAGCLGCRSRRARWAGLRSYRRLGDGRRPDPRKS